MLDVVEYVQVSRKVAVDFLFGETKKADTHRQCTIHMHDRPPGGGNLWKTWKPGNLETNLETWKPGEWNIGNLEMMDQHASGFFGKKWRAWVEPGWDGMVFFHNGWPVAKGNMSIQGITTWDWSDVASLSGNVM